MCDASLSPISLSCSERHGSDTELTTCVTVIVIAFQKAIPKICQNDEGLKGSKFDKSRYTR